MARQTKRQWIAIRKKWENDPRDGYSWLIKELNLSLSRNSLWRRATAEGWTKSELILATKSDAPKKVTRKRNKKITDLEKVHKSPIPAVENPVDPVHCMDKNHLSDKEKLYVTEYLSSGMNNAEACRKLGMTRDGGRIIKKRPQVQSAIRDFIAERAEAAGIEAEAIFKLLAGILEFDANEFTSYVVSCCPRCWSSTERPQLEHRQYFLMKDKWEDRELLRQLRQSSYKIRPFPYELWDKRKTPNPDCPNCLGRGFGEVIIKDTRNLSPLAKIMYCGVTDGKNGIEVATLQKEKALEHLIRVLGLYGGMDNKESVVTATPEELSKLFLNTLTKAAEKQKAVNLERGFVDATIIDTEEDKFKTVIEETFEEKNTEDDS